MGKHDHEVDRVEWFPVDDAILRATYPQEREILRKAETLIRNES
jgi:predicted NUDIX family NTP pyrophosphohydrolase